MPNNFQLKQALKLSFESLGFYIHLHSSFSLVLNCINADQTKAPGTIEKPS